MITNVADGSQVAEARRLVQASAKAQAFSDDRAGQVALVVTELATNLLKHGGGGLILARPFDDKDGVGLEVMALDRGRGMADVERCMRDGYSTAGSPGNGLGAVIRQADLVRIYSRPDQGTAIMARFVTRAAEARVNCLIGAALAPYPGETLCGDSWQFADVPAGRTLLVVDGSGHGREAARAADLAVQLFQQHAAESCDQLAERLHRGLAPTRGGALAIARVDTAARHIRYVGIGNIVGIAFSDGTVRRMVSHNGTAGHIAPRIREFIYPFTAPPLIIMHSDGIGTRWDLTAYPGLALQHPSLIAGVILRDHRRERDDASVVVMRALA